MKNVAVSSKRVSQWSVGFLTLIAVIFPITFARAVLPGEQPYIVSYQPGEDNDQLVIVRLNEKTTATFLLDTGTTTTQIFPELAARMKLHPEPLKSHVGEVLNNKQDDENIVHVRKFQFGTVTLSDVPLALPKVDAISSGSRRKIDGIIGMNFLAQYAVLFDFQKHQLMLWKNGKLSLAQRKQCNMEKASSVPIIDIYKSLQYFARVRINGTTEEDMLIDSGGSATIISAPIARNLKLTSLGNVIAHPIYGPQPYHIGVVDKLDIGDYTTGAVTLWYPERDGGPIPPVLGRDFLTQHRILMDFPDNRMYFAPVERQTKIIPFSSQLTFDLPLFDVHLTDNRVHMLGLSTINWSVLDSSLEAKWPAIPADLNPSPSADTKMVMSKLDLPTGKLLFDYNGRENLDTESGKNKLDSSHHEKTTFTRFQS